jgi:hypothetical protein
MRADDRADALSRYFEPRVYQRNRAHLCLPGRVKGLHKALAIDELRFRTGRKSLLFLAILPLLRKAMFDRDITA